MKTRTFFLLAFLSAILHTQAHALCSVSPINENQYLFAQAGMMTATPDERYVFALDESAWNVAVIDTAYTTVIANIGLAGELAGMALDAAGGRLFVSGLWDGTVYKINVANPEQAYVETSRQLGNNFLGPVAYDAVRQRVIVADTSAGTLLVLSPTDLSVQGAPIQGGGGDSWAGHLLIAGDTLYVGYETSVGVFDLSGAAPVYLGSVAGLSPAALAASPDGAKIYVANWLDNTVAVIDAASRTLLDTISHPDYLSAPGGLAYLNSALWIANQSRGELIQYSSAIEDLLTETRCQNLTGVRPTYLLALPQAGVVYAAHSTGIDAVRYVDNLLVRVQRPGKPAPVTVLDRFVADLGELVELTIEGGTGRFEILTNDGMRATPTADARAWLLAHYH